MTKKRVFYEDTHKDKPFLISTDQKDTDNDDADCPVKRNRNG